MRSYSISGHSVVPEYVILLCPHVPAGSCRKYRHYSGSRHYSLTLFVPVVSVCAKRFHRNYSGKPALLNRLYRRTTAALAHVMSSFAATLPILVSPGQTLHYALTNNTFGTSVVPYLYSNAGMCQPETPTLQWKPELLRMLTVLVVPICAKRFCHAL